jgi:hypothetical protein
LPAPLDLTVITSGLNEGEHVVTDGQHKLQADAPVTIEPAAARPNREAALDAPRPGNHVRDLTDGRPYGRTCRPLFTQHILPGIIVY